MTYKLMQHQNDALNIARSRPRFAFFDDTGTGKTLEGIEIALLHNVKTLILCPLSIINAAWIHDIEQFAPQLFSHTINLWDLAKKKNSDSGAIKYKFGLQNCKIAIINYESLKTNFQTIKEAGFKMLIVDESSKIKTYRMKTKQGKMTTTKSVIEFADSYAEYVYLFSGTPAPNSELEYYSQMRCLSRIIFGRSYYAFRNTYCYPSGYGGYKWIMKQEMKQLFMEKLAQWSRVVRKEDVLDLPPRTHNVRHVILSSSELEAYKKMKNDFMLEYAPNTFLAVNSMVKIMKLREITSGFVLGEGGIFKIIGDSKLKELIELLEEIGNHHQVIIWCQFHSEMSRIEAEFQKLQASYARIDGSVKQEERDAIITNFKDRSIHYLIAHPKTLGHGHTLTTCSYCIYYSLSYSLEEFVQSQDRIYRKGQENKCSYYYLLAKSTVDEVIYKALQQKSTMVEAVFNFIKGEKS